MKIIITAIVALIPVVLAQDPPDVIKQVQVRTAAGGVAGATFAYVAGELVGGNPVKGAPYSAQALTEMTQTLADGNRISHSSSSMIYRDSMGRERREQSMGAIGPWKAQGDPQQVVFISDPVAGVNYELDPKNKTARKMPAPPPLTANIQKAGQPAGGGDVFFQAAPFDLPVPPPGGAVAGARVMIFNKQIADGTPPAGNTEQLGTKTIEGVPAEGTRTTITIPAGQIGNERALEIVSERWYSPELKVTVMSRQSDPRSGETVYRLTQINRTEPIHSMFEVPADYTITEMPAIMKFDRAIGTVHKPE